MATYELYLGGPASANASRAMFPAPTFSAAAAVFKAMRPSLHKGNFLNRVLDFGNDHALKHFVAQKVEDGAPITTADILGLLVIPQNILVRGAFYEVEVAGGTGLILTPAFRDGAQTLPAIAGDATSKGFAAISAGAWVTTNAAAAGNPQAMAAGPDMLDLAVTAIGDGFGSLRLNLGLVFDDLTAGQY